jgi:hypothetical protein
VKEKARKAADALNGAEEVELEKVRQNTAKVREAIQDNFLHRGEANTMATTSEVDLETSDFDTVAMNPAAIYEGPSDVLADPDLTREQKLRLLEEWEIDLKRTLESDAEGMAQGPDTGASDESRSADDSALLRQVANWLRRARGEDDGEPFPEASGTVIGRLWKRLFGSSSAPKTAA